MQDTWTEWDWSRPWWERGEYNDPRQVVVWRVVTADNGMYDVDRGPDGSWRLLTVWD